MEYFSITFELCKLLIIFLQNIIFDCLKPIYNFLRALGVFPLSKETGSDEFHFHVQSPAMAYSFLIFVVLMVNIYSSGFIVTSEVKYDVVSFHRTLNIEESKKYIFARFQLSFVLIRSLI